jgi:hypothetical protein
MTFLFCVLSFFFFWSRISSTCGLIAYPLFLNTADAIGCNQSRVEWLATACVVQVAMKHQLPRCTLSLTLSRPGQVHVGREGKAVAAVSRSRRRAVLSKL